MVELIRNYGSSSVNSELFISYERWKRFYREQFLQAHVMHACTHARSHTHTHTEINFGIHVLCFFKASAQRF